MFAFICAPAAAPRAERLTKRILDACDKLFRRGSATPGALTEERSEGLNAMSLDEVIVALNNSLSRVRHHFAPPGKAQYCISIERRFLGSSAASSAK
jgi:hypothetical protein